MSLSPIESNLSAPTFSEALVVLELWLKWKIISAISDSTPFISFKMGDENQSYFPILEFSHKVFPTEVSLMLVFTVFTQRLNKKKIQQQQKWSDFSLELEKLLIQACRHLYTSLTFTRLKTLLFCQVGRKEAENLLQYQAIQIGVRAVRNCH